MTNDKPEHPGFASPPCFAHELDANGNVPTLSQNDVDITAWRKAKRAELITARLAVPVEERERVAAQVAEVLDQLIDFALRPTVSLYWPFRGELDLREWMHRAHARGAQIALPVVAAKSQPMVFREWAPGCKMERGIWKIPVPSESNIVTPTVVVSPLVGHDPDCFRLGYGGGFFDRTLLALSPRPMVIGVGHPCSSIPTIYSQPHDIPMDVIVTGKNSVRQRS